MQYNLTYSQSPAPFITQWFTTTQNETITIPTFSHPALIYDYKVDWGDGTITSGETGNATHQYASQGMQTVSITGTFPRIHFHSSPATNKAKIHNIVQWGDIEWIDMNGAFRGTINLKSTASDKPDLSRVMDMTNMFEGAILFNGDSGIPNWDVSNVKNMSGVFKGAASFDRDLSAWKVNNVVQMSDMFNGAINFNNGGNLGGLNIWRVDNVTRMSAMFKDAQKFNCDISGWNVSKVGAMNQMFLGASIFNGDLSNWIVSEVEYMNEMFRFAEKFNNKGNVNGLNSWDVRKVKIFFFMFDEAYDFNCDISGWKTYSARSTAGMFRDAISFNQELKDWDVSLVVDMSLMFKGAKSFTSDLSEWKVNNVEHMHHLFQGATKFESDLSDWVVNKVEDMEHMFQEAELFNSDLSGWNVSNVKTFASMFFRAYKFDCDLGDWEFGPFVNTNMTKMLSYSGLSINNYDNTLIGWADYWLNNSTMPNGMRLGAMDLIYCFAKPDRKYLTDPLPTGRGWTIIGDSLYDPYCCPP